MKSKFLEMVSRDFEFPETHPFDDEMVILSSEEDEINGVIINKPKLVNISFSDSMAGYQFSDFSISNLKSVGAVDYLSRISTFSNSAFNVVDSIPDFDDLNVVKDD